MTCNVLSVISLDWFQINVRSEFYEKVVYDPGCEVKLIGRTKVWDIAEEIFIGGQRWATVTRLPRSQKTIPSDTILIKFDNWLLYTENLYQKVEWFLNINNFTFRNISRIDVCKDFHIFRKGLHPETFITRWNSKRYVRKYRAKGSTNFNHKETTEFNGIKFGSKTSFITMYLYNKTLELFEVKNKPYIKEKWVLNGLSPDHDVWRLEFACHGSNRGIYIEETSEFIDMNGLEMLKPENIVMLFNTILVRNWAFYYAKKGQVRKDRLKRLEFFDDLHDVGVLQLKGVEKEDSTRSDRIFIKKLYETMNEFRGRDPIMYDKHGELLEQYVEKHGLHDWASHKGFKHEKNIDHTRYSVPVPTGFNFIAGDDSIYLPT